MGLEKRFAEVIVALGKEQLLIRHAVEKELGVFDSLVSLLDNQIHIVECLQPGTKFPLRSCPLLVCH